MKHRVLGGTGISVSEFALGAMTFGEFANADHDESVRMIHTALDAGINFIDTADFYSQGESEQIVGKALKGRRDDVVVATKFFFPMGDEPNHRGGSARWIKRAVEDSLRRLDMDYIDLYQMHRPDPYTDIEESLSALTDLVRDGKVRSIGSSTFPAEKIVEAQWAAEKRGYQRFRAEQPPYSILTRGIERDVLPTAQKYGMGVLTWSPLMGGWLSGRVTPAGATGQRAQLVGDIYDMSDPANQAKLAAVEQLSKLADDSGMSLPHLAIAFVLAHPAVTSVIIGASKPQHLTDLLAGADIRLSEDILDKIDEIVAPGTNLRQGDTYYTPPAIADKRLRRTA
ncbi:aldo/keto reductase [Kibdelosporangium philippinense]|uniref:Aldo/keto reductase n=1 Tax=Kibdelosporangium philippinense TaxID=211113 RepID=A0ABS8Z681_9PSEU|nr:aldo/keto reductase [Kibdelosporangium philippinense]MCE7003391.1 aldo/keto reductase [Kibdelosporangium philippinense]